jgi:hypothetical protein
MSLSLPDLVKFLFEVSLQSSHPLCEILANQTLTKVMDRLGHNSDDDMHLICLSRNREQNK